MEELWSREQRAAFLTSTLTTAGGLVFAGDADRYYRAFDIRTGEVLWETRLGAKAHGYPITYEADGRQFIAVPAALGGAFRSLTAHPHARRSSSRREATRSTSSLCRSDTSMDVYSKSLTRAGLLGFLVLVVATGRLQGTQESEPVRETIVYSSIQPSNWDLYLFESPGSQPRRLTTDPGLDYNGTLSPDGRWVVFTSERSGNPDLYVLDLEGDAGPRAAVRGAPGVLGADVAAGARAAGRHPNMSCRRPRRGHQAPAATRAARVHVPEHGMCR